MLKAGSQYDTRVDFCVYMHHSIDIDGNSIQAFSYKLESTAASVII